MRVISVGVRSCGRAFPSRKIENQQVKNNNISFGKFESPDIEDDLNSAIPYKDFRDEKRINHLKNTPFATVKKGQNKQGETILYVVMNKDVTDKHKNKEFFNRMLEKCKELVKLGALSYLDIIETKIPEKEPYFIGPITDDIDLADVCNNLENAEEGWEYTGYTGGSDDGIYQKQEDDLWMEAVLREIHS